jgi:hypothetical protein
VKPVETTEFGLQFAVQLSPWWLLLFVPLVAALAWLLYRVQFRGIPRWSTWSLVLLRALFLVGIVFLAFRPSAVLRKILTYPGRIVFVFDDSESMAAKDSGMSDEESLRLARELEPKEREQGERYHELAERLSDIEDVVRKFEVFQRGMDRGKDVFWDGAEKAQSKALECFERFETLAASAPTAGEESQAVFKTIVGEVKEHRAGLDAFFRGDRSPEKQSFDLYCAKLADLRKRLFDLQAALDRRALTDGNEALKIAADAVRGQIRLDIASESLSRLKGSLSALVPGQFFLTTRLMAGEQGPMEEFAPEQVKSRRGVTDIVSRLDQLLNEESEFPLTALVLLSDGRDLGGKSLAALQEALSRKQVPVYAAGVGSEREPLDIAALEVRSPPFAVKGLPIRVTARVKTVLKEPVPAQVEVLSKAQPVAIKEVTLGVREAEQVELGCSPGESGLFRFTFRCKTAPGETFPVENNSMDFAVNVRDEKVKVLFLDWKPRWETRFALNIFQRMEFIELNSIIALVQENTTLKRGVGKGAWPESLAALETYDLIVLGDLPDDLLSPAEWQDVKAAVLEKGKTVCFIGSGQRDPAPAAVAGALLPVRPRKLGGDPKFQPTDLFDLAATDTGAFHPTTFLLARGLKRVPETPQTRSLPDTQALVLDAKSGEPVVCGRFLEKGKTMLVDTDLLWKLLNPTMLSAHAEIYIGLVAWAVEGGFAETADGESKTRLGLDRRTLVAGNRLQVWASGSSADSVVEALGEDGTVLAQAKAAPARADSALARAEFENLPPRDIVFRLRGTEAKSGHTVIVEDYPELKFLSLNEDFLRRLTSATGGEYRRFTELGKLFLQMQPKERVEKQERIWRLWDAGSVLALLVVLITLEWVWRKWVGLV